MKLQRLFLFSLVLAASLSLMAFRPMIQEGPPEMTLSAILLWIATGPGAAWLVGLLMAQVLENFPWWHNLPAQVKFMLSVVLVGGLPILAQLALGWPGLAVIEPWVNMAIMAIVAWLGSQYMYRQLKASAPQYGIRG